MPDLRWWQWALIAWPFVSFAVAVFIGRRLRVMRKMYENEDRYWADQTRRSRSRWN